MKTKHPSASSLRRRVAARRKWLVLAVVGFAFGCSLKLSANPTGITVGLGSATAQTSGAQLNVTVSQAAFLNWSSFNIQAGETTTFIQPSANSVVLNEIGGANPSQIFGNLNANGTVILANANGFYFGPNSMIKVGGDFIATTAPLTPDFGSGSSWTFTGMPPLASIINYGSIQSGNGRSLFLIAENIQNNGSLNAPGGNISLAAGQTVLVSERPDGRGLSASVQVPAGAVNNLGQITADAGTIALQAEVVNQNGIIQANSVQNQNGVIELVASDQLNLGANSQILAQGDGSTPGSAGGNVTLLSGNKYNDSVGSQIITTGGAQGGNGGNVEISAPNVSPLNSSIDASAQAGSSAGQFSLGLANIVLGTSATYVNGPDGGGTLNNINGLGTSYVNVNNAFKNITAGQILLEASGNISLNANTIWNLTASSGSRTSGQLTLEAGGNIIFGNGSQITDANNWAVNLDAGYSFANHAVMAGIGNIYLNNNSGNYTGGGSIQTGTGNINLTAGQSVLVGGGFIRSIAGGTTGGNINVTALAGDISVGSLASGIQNSGYQFSFNNANYPNGYRVSRDSGNNINLGGISTAAGGNVTLTAGHDINPVVGQATPAISGAFGDQPGNVTLIAGNQVFGNFNVANGRGTILAGLTLASGSVTQTLNPGANVGSDDNPLTLSLIAGSWNVWAANNIYINEVRNPNGSFNNQNVNVPAGTYSGNQDDSSVPNRTRFLYDYAADAAVHLWAGNAIELVGSSMPRSSGYPSTITEPIYAPILTLNAGAGGITIDKSIILTPSSAGSLQITTRDGGNLVGLVQSTTLTGIIMSDSGLPQPDTFEQGRSINPVHPDPVLLNISGNIESFGLNIPTYAQINVVGDTYNFGFIGQNLHPGDATSISVGQTAKENMEHSGILNPATDANLRVGGAITYRGDLTQDPLSATDPLSAGLFDAIINGNPALAGILRYDPTAGTLTYVGVMGDNEINYLLNPTDANGQSLIPVAQLASWQADVQKLHDDSQSATLGDQGLAVAGPGYFNVTANDIFLGISGGISVLAPDSALAAISPYGATLNLTTAGNLDMTSTRIANYGLRGGINLAVGGTLDVGGQFTTFGSPTEAKGIFTTSGGDISVMASGNVNVDSSRIAAYNGGNVTVESLTGDVNAGTGGSGYVDVSSLALDPSGHLITLPQSRIPGSGILATTVSGSHAALGNILVETPNGSISASKGGVVQIAFNDADNARATVELLAGYELQDAIGNRVSAANLADGTAVRISDNRNIEATGSGVIAQNLILKATGLLSGLFVNFAPTPPIVVASGWGPGPTVFIGPAPPTISGIPSDSTGPDPIIISDTGSSAPPPAEAAKTDAPIADTAATVTTKTENQDDGLGDDENKKKGNGIVLTQKTGRVTVILPAKTSAKSQTPNPGI